MKFFCRRIIRLVLMNQQKSLILIVALTASYGIGRSNALPWKLKNEMAYFKRVTSFVPTFDSFEWMNVVLMGRKTWESLPLQFRPLKGRINVIISRKESLDPGQAKKTEFKIQLTILDREYIVQDPWMML